MEKIAFVSAAFGGIDSIKPLPTHHGIDAFCYVDEPAYAQASRATLATWTRVIIPNYPRHDFGPRLRSHYFKHQLYRLDEARAHDWLVWSDSSCRFRDMSFIPEWVARLEKLPPQKRLLLIPHPERKSVQEEYDAVQTAIAGGSNYLRVRYANEKMPEQMEYLRQHNWNAAESKLWCGTVWMIENSDLLRQCWDDWWDQVLRFGVMDQLSLPFILDRHGLDPQILDVHLYENVFWKHEGHLIEA